MSSKEENAQLQQEMERLHREVERVEFKFVAGFVNTFFAAIYSWLCGVALLSSVWDYVRHGTVDYHMGTKIGATTVCILWTIEACRAMRSAQRERSS